MNPIVRWLERKRLERELSAEMSEHLRERMEDLMEQGHSEDEALHLARRQFGNLTLQGERSREAWGWSGVEQFGRDLQFALRLLAKSPGFALTALVTLTLGIGASTAFFTVLDSVVLRPLAYQDSGRLVVAWERVRFLGSDPTGPNPRHVDRWEKQATAFSGLTIFQQSATGLALGGEHPQMVGLVASQPDLLTVLAVQPFMGRTFRPADGVKGRDQVAILTYDLWRSAFAGDPDVLGKTVRVSDTPREIVGILPPSFTFPNVNALSNRTISRVPDPGVFIPVPLELNELSWDGDYGNWIALGRLKPGVSMGSAQAQLNAIETELVHERLVSRDNDPGTLRAFVEPMQEAVVGRSRSGLWLLMAAVLGLMLTACLNLANAQLGRALARGREVAVRSALGASRWRLISSALAESLLLALAGGAAGVLLAQTAVTLLRHYAPLDLPRLGEVHLNTGVLLFAFLLTAGSSLLFGLLPVLKLLHADPQDTLQRTSNRATGNRRSSQLRACLIGLQVFGCTLLLLLTGLFSKSLLHLLTADKGFKTKEAAIAEVDLSSKTYRESNARIAFDDAVLENLRAIPGVRSAAMVSAMPLEGESWIEELQRTDQPRRDTPLLNLRWVSPGYFETIGEKLVAGRLFEERDRNLDSAILSESEARAVWPNQDPLGARIKLEGRGFTVVGIVADSRNTSLKSAPPRMAYVHYKDRPPFAAYFVARGSLPAEQLIPQMRQAIWKHDPGATIARVKSLAAQVNDSVSTERFQAFVLAAFGAAALSLAMLGIYGLLSYSVSMRKHEIGIRMAIGASRKEIYRITLIEAALPVGLGLAAGWLASVSAGRIVANLLYGVRKVDASVSVTVAAVLLCAALAASFLPARRAASVDPSEALRVE